MRKRDINDLLVQQDMSIKKVMQVIDRTVLNTAFVIDEDGKLVGSVSDGDIRRAILSGCDVSICVKEVMHTSPVFLKKQDVTNGCAVNNAIKRLQDELKGCPPIPIVDSRFHPVELLTLAELPRRKAPAVRRHRRIKRVLVVGGAGFLGSVLVKKLLDEGYRVRVLDNLMYGWQPIRHFLQNKKFQSVKGDMRDISVLVQALKKVDVVINLAAIVGDPACKASPSATIETNYLANKILAEACKYNQINRFIFASTCSVYGCSENAADETSKLNPLSLYTRSKIHSEEGILSLEDGNFSPTIFRMATLYGYSPRMRFDLVVNTMVKDAFYNGKIMVHGGGTQWRPLLAVNDGADAYVKCLEAPLEDVKGEIFNLGSEKQNYRILDIAQKVQKLLPGTEILFDAELYDARDYFVSFEKIRKRLGFCSEIDIDSAILEIKHAMESNLFSDADHSKYYNARYLQDAGHTGYHDIESIESDVSPKEHQSIEYVEGVR